MSRAVVDVFALAAALFAGLTSTRAHAQPVPGMPEPGETPPLPAGGATEATELEASPRPGDRRDGPGPGWVILPGINYAPEPGLTVGAALLRYFRVGDDEVEDRRLSSYRFTTSVSFKKRGEVSIDPHLWAADDRLQLTGTLNASYFDYPFYGIGNDTSAEDREDFTAVRVHARPEAAARVWHELYAGLVYDFRYVDITAIEQGGMIDSAVEGGDSGVVGGEGGVLSGVGGILRWDSRDHSFSPRSGGLLSFSPRLYRRGLGSEHNFGRLLFDASWFVGLGGDHVVAVDGRADFRTGAPPFDHMSLAGGSRLLRGMIEGRYRDNHYLGGQVEYRFPLFWRVGGVAFGGVGRVADEIRDFELDGWHWAAGGGLRFAVNRDERINVRLDAGATAEGNNMYLAIGEAF